MSSSKHRALVVDDEAQVRGLTVRALAAEGFSCDTAADGVEAVKRMRAGAYDAVVTDLKMPNKHGHALAVELLAEKERPAVVVLTGVLEPKLAKDLIRRGVDAVEFKPVNYDLFAAKVRAIVDRRNVPSHKSDESPSRSPQRDSQPPGNGASVELADLEEQLPRLSKMLPVSNAALDVFNMAASEDSEADQIAAAIARDSALTVDVLRLANSSLYNTSGEKTVEIDEAVVRIGLRRTGELALATSALAALTANMVPWMNVELAWRRSMAAGVATEVLAGRGSYARLREGLFLSAIMHNMGRIVLGTLYPERYRKIVRRCEMDGSMLVNRERVTFPLTHTQVMARLLEIWDVPRLVSEPLEHVADRYPALAGLAGPVRTKTELVKISALVGRIAVGPWEAWDRVEFPPAAVLGRLGIDAVAELIEQTRIDLELLAGLRRQPAQTDGSDHNAVQQPPLTCRLPYCTLSPEPFDFLAQIMPSMGIALKPCSPGEFDDQDGGLVNCIGAPPHRLAAAISPRGASDRKLIVTDADHLEPYARFGRALSLPAGYGALRRACREAARPLEQPRAAALV